MNTIIFHKIFVRSFYRSHASFFFLVIAIGAGFMRGIEHIALAEFFTGNTTYLCIPLLAGWLYGMQVIRFNAQVLTEAENEFVFHFMFLPRAQQILTLLSVTGLQLAPFFVYSLFLLVIALQHRVLSSAAWIIACASILLLLVMLMLHFALHHPHRERKLSLFKRTLDNAFPKAYPFMVLEWLGRHHIFLLIGTKIFSGLILWGTLALYDKEEYDLRLLALGLMVVCHAQAALALEVHRFDNFHLSLLRHLPLSFGKRIYLLFWVIFLLTLPETGVLMNYFPAGFTFPDRLQVHAFVFSIPLLHYGLLYYRRMNQEQLMPVMLVAILLSFILILFGFPLWLFALASIVAGVWTWRRYYYRFEYVAEQ